MVRKKKKKDKKKRRDGHVIRRGMKGLWSCESGGIEDRREEEGEK